MTGLTAKRGEGGGALSVGIYMTFPGKCIIDYYSKKLEILDISLL